AAAAHDHHAVEVVGDLDQRGADRLAGRGVLLVRERAADAAAIDADRHAAARTATLDRARIVDFAGFGVDHPHIDRDVGLGLLAAERDALEADAATGARGVFLVRGDGTEHEVLRAGHVAHLRAGTGTHATGRREVLFFQHVAELVALQDAEVARAGQLVGQHARQLPAHAAAPPGRAGFVLEFRHADRGLVRRERGPCADHAGQRQHGREKRLLHLITPVDFGPAIPPPDPRTARTPQPRVLP